MLKPLIDELRVEAATTRRVLERLPEDKLTWKPHAKSMSLGVLAQHVAGIPGSISKLAQPDSFDAANASFAPPQPETVRQVLDTHEEGVAAAEKYLGSLDEAAATSIWKLTMGDKEMFAMPRIQMLRTIMFNHLYHHRGQLSVYLRLLDVPVPSIYGPSADDNPFAGR